MQAPLTRTVGVRRDYHHRDYGDEVRYRRDEADLKIAQARKAAHNLWQPQTERILAERNTEEHKETHLPYDRARERSSDAEAMMLDTSVPFGGQAFQKPPALFGLQPCRVFRPIRQVT
jgi:hypothetical protein